MHSVLRASGFRHIKIYWACIGFVSPGADLAAGRGASYWLITGVQGAGVGKFCISELNSRDLVHTFFAYIILKISWSISNKNAFNYGRTIWKWVIYPAYASPSSNPSLYRGLARLILFCHCRYFVVPTWFLKQIMLYRSSSMFNCKESKQKRGSRGQSPLAEFRGKAPWSWRFPGVTESW